MTTITDEPAYGVAQIGTKTLLGVARKGNVWTVVTYMRDLSFARSWALSHGAEFDEIAIFDAELKYRVWDKDTWPYTDLPETA